MKILYPNNGRKLKHMITWLLKSWLATKIQRINYVKSYTLIDKKIVSEEHKLVDIFYKPEDQEKIKNMIKKTRPEARIL